MVIAMVGNATPWIKAFPAKGGVSATLSPRTILNGERFDHTKHCRIAFGSYAQLQDEPSRSNTQIARMSDAICMGPAANLHGGYNLWHLTSGKKITRCKWTELPMPQKVIARVNQLGQADGQPKPPTFYSRKGQLTGDQPEYNETPGVDRETTGVDMDGDQVK
jgi:hypothetical protein